MNESTNIFAARARRLRKALMIVGALMLFVAGLILLLAPASAQDCDSRTEPLHFHGGASGWTSGWIR